MDGGLSVTFNVAVVQAQFHQTMQATPVRGAFVECCSLRTNPYPPYRSDWLQTGLSSWEAVSGTERGGCRLGRGWMVTHLKDEDECRRGAERGS